MEKAEKDLKAATEVEEVETEEVEEETEAETPPEEATATEEEAPEAEGVTVQIGEDSPPSDDEETPPMRQLRQQYRETKKELDRLKRESAQATAPKVQPLRAKPTLEGHDFDTEKYETDLDKWHAERRTHEAKEQESRAAQEAEQSAWQAKLDDYGKKKTELKVPDYEEAESTMADALGTTQQAIILNGSDNPAIVVYALGKNPKRLAELAAIKDPVKFAFAVAKLETQLKVTPRKAPPAPERKITGVAPVTGADKTLERLEAEADRTGDRTKVLAYKRSLRAKAE